MIGRLRGRVLEKHAPELLLDVAGVGYEVLAPMTTFYRLGAAGDEVTLHTHLIVREDAHLLFGFFTREERTLFRELIKVNGVGPKLALGILSGVETDAFVRCVQDGDVATLTRIPGIGKKTAERLVVEMRDRLKALGEVELRGGLPTFIAAAPATPAQDAQSALEALGYKPVEAARAVAAVNKEAGLGSEELIRRALRSLAKTA
ncbi:MAG: Holliday junction branch migration protein RuvA [Pseudomonadota bacterium]